MTKKEHFNGNKRRSKQQPDGKIGIQNLELKTIRPLTISQEHAFEAWEEEQDLVLSGFSGTGKTFLACYLALSTGLDVYVVRSAVPTRDMGFMPGNDKEKASYYEGPYVDACRKLFGRGDAYEILIKTGRVKFVTTSFLRGLTFDNCVVITDEVQNLNFHELDTVITRAGENCRMIFSGDYRQTDFERDKDKEGLKKFLGILEKIETYDVIEFGINDIVRSDRVRSYIIAKESD